MRRPPLTLALATLVAVQAAAQAPPGTRDFADRSEVSSVLIPVTVWDRRGRLLPTLERDAFALYIDGLRFPITSFWREAGLPLSLAVVLDTSGSMGVRRLGQARQAIEVFLAQLGPRDEACLITFGGGEVKRRLAFGADPAVIPQILAGLEAGGTTALYDVLAAAPQIMSGANHLRRAILLFTDGVDTASRLSAEDARRILEDVSDPLYAFGIEPPPRTGAGEVSYETILESFGTASGGRYIPVPEARELAAMARGLRRELTMRYIISVGLSGLGAMKWREIEVRVEGGGKVVARQGYRGTLP